MRVKALVSFVGKISMNIDEEKEVVDTELVKDLIKAGYVEEVKDEVKISIGSTTNDKPKGRKKK